MDLRPLHDRVVVRRLEEQETMRGGLFVPDSAKEKPQQAEVMAVGEGKVLETVHSPMFGAMSGAQ